MDASVVALALGLFAAEPEQRPAGADELLGCAAFQGRSTTLTPEEWDDCFRIPHMPSDVVATAEPQRGVILCEVEHLSVCDPRGCWSEFPGALGYLVNLEQKLGAACADVMEDECDELAPFALSKRTGSVIVSHEADALQVDLSGTFVRVEIFPFEDGERGAEITFGRCQPYRSKQASAE
jgi:hypothetical protein